MEAGDREAIRRSWICGLAQKVDCRKDLRLDQLQSRLARDFERYTITVAAFVRLAMIRIMLRRLAANASSSIQTYRMGS